MFRWQLLDITQDFGHELRQEPLGWKKNGLVYPAPVPGALSGHWHRGVDLAAPYGTPVQLHLSGRIIVPSFDPMGFGFGVQCDGSRYRTTYGHLSRVDTGTSRDGVHGDAIGLSGSSGNSTGPHIHWEVFDKLLGAFVEPWTVC